MTLNKVLAILWGTGWRLIVVGSFSKQATFKYRALQKGPYCLARECEFLYQFKIWVKAICLHLEPFLKLMVRGIWSCRYQTTGYSAIICSASCIYHLRFPCWALFTWTAHSCSSCTLSILMILFLAILLNSQCKVDAQEWVLLDSPQFLDGSRLQLAMGGSFHKQWWSSELFYSNRMLTTAVFISFTSVVIIRLPKCTGLTATSDHLEDPVSATYSCRIA